MKHRSIGAVFITVIGCALLGVWANSWMVGVGVYCCIVGLKEWD